MRRDIDKKLQSEEGEEIFENGMKQEEVETEKKSKPIKIGVHVIYEDKEFVVQDIKGEKIFIAMGNEEQHVEKSDVEVIE